MIIWFITIISILVIYWFQYPYINNKDNERKYKYINFFNHIKIPLFVGCVIILIYIISSCTKKPDLAIDLMPLNF